LKKGKKVGGRKERRKKEGRTSESDTGGEGDLAGLPAR
jgi:hypothetical protein